jgi:putative transposase
MLLSERRSAAAMAASFAWTSSGSRRLICFMAPIISYTGAMSRFRLYPSTEQEAALLRHCSDARFVWNLGQEQRSMYRPGRGPTPGFAEQCRQLTDARRAEPWLAGGSQNVQQQALRDLDQAWRNFFAGTHRRPRWRKRDQREGFRITDFTFGLHVRQLNRHWSQVKVPKVGWVRFRRSRNVPEAKSYRVTRDRAGRWHVAFAVIPAPIEGPGTGEVVGIDRGVAVSLALSTGEMNQVPAESGRTQRLARRLSRAKRGSNRRQRTKARFARARALDADRRKDWAEKTGTDIARRFDLIRVEDLRIRNMTRKPAPKPDPEKPGAFLPNGARAKAGLDRGILASGWGLFAQRLEQKAPGRVEKVHPAYTSQRCSACGHIAAESRKSQALFACVACTYTGNADVNAARNIAAGHAVTARGGGALARPVNREPLAGAA